MNNMIEKKLNVVFPMAGEGSRFGYTFKPFISVGDLTFIERAISPFLKHEDKINKFYFIVTEEQEKENKVRVGLDKILDVPFDLIIIPEKTSGPHQTIVKASTLNTDILDNVIICDCDHSIDVDCIFSDSDDFDCIIPVWNIEDNEQSKWSKVVYLKDELSMICEKEIINSPDIKMYGIIGCVYFKSLRCFNDKDVYISDALKSELKSSSNIKTYRPTFADFFGDPDRLEQFADNQSTKMTFFFDFDGTLVAHNSTPNYTGEDLDVLVDLNELRELKNKGHRIVITTARSNTKKEEMIELLDRYNFPYDDLVMGCNSGPRIIVNDIKPRKPFVRMARSINLKRDSGFSLDASSYLSESDRSVFKKLGGFSPAEKLVINSSDLDFVRKIIYKLPDNKLHVDKLKMQSVNLKRFSFLWENSTPMIFDESETDDWYFYDMEYFNETDGWELLENVQDKKYYLTKLLSGLNKNVYCLDKPVDGVMWLKNHIANKIIPRFSIDDPLIKKIFFEDDLVINGRKTISIEKYMSSLNYVNFVPNKICPTHGDLTFENILINKSNDSIKMIDSDGSDFYDASELDLGKMYQSEKMKYSSWVDDDWKEKENQYVLSEKFFNGDSSVEDCLISLWSEILVEDRTIVKNKAIFFAVLHLIRLIPFKLNKNREHAVLSALLSRHWLNWLHEKEL